MSLQAGGNPSRITLHASRELSTGVLNDDNIEQQLQELFPQFAHWEKTKDLIDQLLDIILNYRQSGHPGGSRSKVHILVATLLGGAMRWDIRNPEKRFGDRFVLVAGHTIPLVYCTLAVLNEALRIKLPADRRQPLRRPRRRRKSACCSGRICWASGAAAGCRATPRWRARPSS